MASFPSFSSLSLSSPSLLCQSPIMASSSLSLSSPSLLCQSPIMASSSLSLSSPSLLCQSPIMASSSLSLSTPSLLCQSPIVASSSLSLSPLSSSPRNWIHDVFPSFHGEDVRKGFLSHILKEFRSKGIYPFIDNEIKRGESISPELIRAIRGSKIGIVLLSKNYASSSWCLDELVEIIKSRTELDQKVMVVFYEVDPTDVQKQTGDFGKAFKETCRGKTEEEIETWRQALEGLATIAEDFGKGFDESCQGKTEEEIETWRQALADVATIAGYHSSNWDTETAMIERIATDVSDMLNNFTQSRDNDRLVGMEAHTERLKPLLRLDLEDEVRMIGIWGPPGIGKSTLARFLFNQLSRNFQLSAIMVNIKGGYPSPCLDEGSVKLQLQSQMLSNMINHKDIMINHLGVAQERLKDRKVLLVLDDVDQLAQLDALARENRWFGPRSRIIITTEDRRVLDAHGINHIYKVDYPIDEEALQIFCMHAFDQKSPYDGFEVLAQEVIKLSGKLPLGLTIMGSHLRRKSKQEWEMALPRLRNSLDGKIESVLKFSYDALCDEDKNLFLHIACFFDYEKVERVEEHLAKKFVGVKQGLHVLAEKSLISFDEDIIMMHSLLVQLGKEIVRKQSDHEPGRRQFLVDNKDICEILTDPTAIARSVIGINSEYNREWKELNISDRAFEGMSNLQFLRLYGHQNIASLPEHLKYTSPKLQLLDWEYCPMTCLPFIGNLEFLVELIMPYSKLEKLWEGIKLLRNLKWMDLSFSENLNELPNLSTATNLQTIYLKYCSSLVELPSSIGNATNLQKLYLTHCSSLVELPSSIGNATNLQKLNLRGCSSLVELPSSIGNAANLQELDLRGCSSLVQLPSSIGNATNLQKLYFSYCSSLVELPSSIGNATNLQELDLNGCSSLVELPPSIGKLHKLTWFNLEKCSKLEVLPTNINLKSLNELNLTNCSSLKSFPEISTNIKVLKLSGTAIEEVPSSIRSWSRLEELHMPYSENLKESPHAFDIITELHLTDTRIQELSPWVKEFSRLRILVLNEMQNLVSLSQLPDSLEILDAKSCFSLERLDCSFSNPVIRLNFGNCFKLNQEARDLIIQTSTRDYSVLPGGEVPACFTYRASGSSLTVKLNGKPVRTSTKFKACILLVNKGENEVDDGLGVWVKCRITSKQNALTSCRSYGTFPKEVLSEHLYIFDVEAAEVTSSTELDFEFNFGIDTDNWKIKECGILQLLELQVDEDSVL